MRVVVCEKPSVAMSVSKIVGATAKNDGYFEGNGYIVTWCFGHLVSQSPPEEYGEEYNCPPYKQNLLKLPLIPIKWLYEIIQQKGRKGESKEVEAKRKKNNESTKRQFNTIKSLMHDNRVSDVVNACDAGREGELIFRNVYYFADCRKTTSRLWVSSLEESAITDGMNHLRDGREFDFLFQSGLCRAKADWLIGMNGSRLFSSLYSANLSIGRVQTPTLSMIVERDYKVKNFIKEKYYIVELDCVTFTAVSGKFENLATAAKVIADCKGRDATVTELKNETKTVNPPKLYDLTNLQREANRLFGFTAQQTLDATQKLYEKKIVTYPRTDSQFLTDDMTATATSVIGVMLQSMPFLSGFAYTPNIAKVTNNGKVSDHQAIIPTVEVVKIDLNSLPQDERKILLLIAHKLICSTGEKHIYNQVTAKLTCNNQVFTAKGKTVTSVGWKQVEKLFKDSLNVKEDDKNEDDELKTLDIVQGQEIRNPACNLLEKFTSPPKSYTEDSLLSAMETAGNKDYVEGSDVEKKGIGTPATRASVIETLIRKGFIERKSKKIIATDKGVNLIKITPEKVKSAKLTAEWETILQDIEKGKASAESFMAEIERMTRELITEHSTASVEHAKSFAHTPQAVISVGKCPKCGSDVTETPKAFSCGGGRGECKFVLWKNQFYKENALSAAQAKKLLANSKTDKIKGFVSKKSGKTYEAFLVLKDDLSVGMSFE